MLFPTTSELDSFVGRVAPRLNARFELRTREKEAAAGGSVSPGADEFFVSTGLRLLMERAVYSVTSESLENPLQLFQPFFNELKREGYPLRDDEAVFFVREVLHEVETDNQETRMLMADALVRMAKYFPNYATHQSYVLSHGEKIALVKAFYLDQKMQDPLLYLKCHLAEDLRYLIASTMLDIPLSFAVEHYLSGQVTWDGIEDQLVEKFGVDLYELPDYITFDQVDLTAQYHALEAMEAAAHTDVIPATLGKIGFGIQYGNTRKDQVIAFLKEFGKFPTTVQKTDLDPHFVNTTYLKGYAKAAGYSERYPELEAYLDPDVSALDESELKLKRIPPLPQGLDASQIPYINYENHALTYLPLWLREFTSATALAVRGNKMTKIDFPFHKLPKLIQGFGFGDNVTEIKGLTTHQMFCVLTLHFCHRVILRSEAVIGLIEKFRTIPIVNSRHTFNVLVGSLKVSENLQLTHQDYTHLQVFYQLTHPDKPVMKFADFKAWFLGSKPDS